MLNTTFSLALAALRGVIVCHGDMLVHEPFDHAVVQDPVFGNFSGRGREAAIL